MEAKETGGPAFPCEVGPSTDHHMIQTGDRQWQQPGMTLRDYFMAHAPVEPQSWFMPDMAGECPVVPSIRAVPAGDLRLELELYYNDACDAESEEARQWVSNRALIEAAQAAWQFDFRKQRLIQWPAAWADTQLEQRKC